MFFNHMLAWENYGPSWMTGGYAPKHGQGYDPGGMMNHDGVAWVLAT